MSVQFSRDLETLGQQFRLGRSIAACLRLPDVLQSCMQDLQGRTPTQLKAFEELIGCILDCQTRQDWLGLADYLEYDLVQWLHQNGLVTAA
jgi:hypothetical protein